MSALSKCGHSVISSLLVITMLFTFVVANNYLTRPAFRLNESKVEHAHPNLDIHEVNPLKYERIKNYAKHLLSATWIQINNDWLLSHNRHDYFSDRSKCITNARTLFYGDSYCRELYKTVARQTMHSEHVFSDRYNFKLYEHTNPSKDFWGRQVNPEILTFFNSKDSLKIHTFQYCTIRGCGTGVDFEVCGRPDTDDLINIAFSSKSYINTSKWDEETIDWAHASNSSFMIVIAGNWDTWPCDTENNIQAWNRFIDTLSHFKGLIILADINFIFDKIKLPPNFIPFNYTSLQHIPSFDEMTRNGSIHVGHGGADNGPLISDYDIGMAEVRKNKAIDLVEGVQVVAPTWFGPAINAAVELAVEAHFIPAVNAAVELAVAHRFSALEASFADMIIFRRNNQTVQDRSGLMAAPPLGAMAPLVIPPEIAAAFVAAPPLPGKGIIPPQHFPFPINTHMKLNQAEIGYLCMWYNCSFGIGDDAGPYPITRQRGLLREFLMGAFIN
eukprot:gene10472-21845_t